MRRIVADAPQCSGYADVVPGTSESSRPVILCPVEFERERLLAAGLGDRAEIICTGPGAGRVVHWSETKGPFATRVILAGLAGALRDISRPGEAYLVGTVISHDGRQFNAEPELRSEGLDGRHHRRAVVASVPRVVTSAHEKRILADKTGADLVDLESGVFAQAGTILGWRWSIVRGVSDGCDVSMPRDIEQWVGPDGRTRAMRASWSMVTHPWRIPGVLDLRRNARRAMDQAAAIVRDLLERT